MSNYYCRVILLLSLILLTPVSANAQTGGRATLTPPDINDFPLITTYLGVYDNQGEFVHGLSPPDIMVIEENQLINASELSKINTGVQVVFAINFGPSFGIRDVQGNSRYDFLFQALQEWANSDPDNSQDDLSFVINESPNKTHMTTRQEWIENLDAVQTNPRTATPDLNVIVEALEIASDADVLPGMERAVIFLTPPLDDTGNAAIESLTARAKQQGIRVFVWMVSSQDFFNSSGTTQLMDIAEQTGGQYFPFSGEEQIPDPEEYLSPLRNVYKLVYHSKINTSGEHRFSVQIVKGEFEAAAPAQTISLEIQPPNPIFITPPLVITRTVQSRENVDNPAKLTPNDQKLKILIEFPDGYPRSLTKSTLFVNGETIAENTKPPFDQFTWDLQAYKTNADHLLRIEVEDILGLKGQSIEIPTKIVIHESSMKFLQSLSREGILIASLAALIAGAILAMVLVWGGKIRPQSDGKKRKGSSQTKRLFRRKVNPKITLFNEEGSQSRGRLSNWANKFSWSQRSDTKRAYAFLVNLPRNGESNKDKPFPITLDETTFGTDPTLATIVLNDPSIEALHARLKRDNDNAFTLFDEGSIAGTWINYAPISSDGVKVEDGDIIHIGRIRYRFKYDLTKKPPKPVITPMEHF